MCSKDSIINMKYIIGLVFCGLLAVGNGYYCDSESECEEEECCVAYYASNLLGLGSCVKRGRVGAPCNEEDAQLPDTYGGKYLSKCPCRKGITCVPSVSSGTRMQINASQKCQRGSFLGESKNSNSTEGKTETNKLK